MSPDTPQRPHKPTSKRAQAMTYRQAVQAFIDHFPQYMIDNVQQDFDDEDDTVWWTCDVCELDGLLVATAQMPEHWPEIHTDWCS